MKSKSSTSGIKKARQTRNNKLEVLLKYVKEFRIELDNLIEQNADWYEIAVSSKEFQFGEQITELFKIIDKFISSGNERSSFLELIVSKLLELISVSNQLYKNYGVEDKKIIVKFIKLFKNYHKILNGHSDRSKSDKSPIESDKNNVSKIKLYAKSSLDYLGLRGRLLSDSSTDHDLLGFSVYSTAISELIKNNFRESEDNNENKKISKAGKPFNIAIIAPWGHGKTTLMKNIQQELDPHYNSISEEAKTKFKKNENNVTTKETTYNEVRKYFKKENLRSEQINDEFPTVWFNAWRYQSSDQIWAGLGHAIITQLTSRLSLLEQEKFWFKLQIDRLDISKIRSAFYSDLFNRLIPSILVAFLSIICSFILFTKWPYFSFIGLIGLGYSTINIYKKIREKIDGSWSVYFNEPDYAGKLGTYHDIIHDLHKVFTVLLKDNQRVVIFIDDLDRCSPNVIGEVFEAVNLMMVDPIIGDHCYFIFGMDAQVVAAALDNKYALMSGKLKDKEESFGSIGWYFLDKFIQLPFNVPIMSQKERLDFLKYYFDIEETNNVNNKNQENDKEEDTKKLNSIQKLKKTMKVSNNSKRQKELSKLIEEADANIKLDLIKEAVREKLNDEDTENLIEQLNFICTFLSSSPREIIRYINLLRFFNSTLYIRQSMMPNSVSVNFKGIAKYLLITLKWPQMVRWIQWEGDQNLVLYNTTLEKAQFLDKLIQLFKNENESLFSGNKKEELYSRWKTYCDSNIENNSENTQKKLPWLYDKEILEIFFHKETYDASFTNALLSKMW